jgi:ATP-dependent DNA helicase RecQ
VAKPAIAMAIASQFRHWLARVPGSGYEPGSAMSDPDLDPTEAAIRGRAERLLELTASAADTETCALELRQLRHVFQASPRLFSADTIELLRQVAGSLRERTSPQQILESVFGYHQFRPGQRELIDAVLAGRDAVGIMPTGAGKSLIYQIPARLLDGTALVVSPLIALMKDQVDALDQVGLRSCYLNSSLSLAERRERIARAGRGEFELIYAAPEGLEASVGQALKRIRLSLIAVDEAHCISQWGHDFRPAYRNLLGLKQVFGRVPVLGLTATATHVVTADIIEQLGMQKPLLYRGSFYRPNLHLHACAKGGAEGSRRRSPVRERVRKLVQERSGDSGIVYCLSRKSTEALASFLRAGGAKARAYHAGMEAEERTEVQDAFRRDEVDVVVATIAFGMGIDKSNIRYVIHADMPRSLECYYQEIGRAGRDGVPSDCILFYSWAEVRTYDRFADEAPPEIGERMRTQAREMFRFALGNGCRHEWLVGYFGEKLERCRASCDNCSGVDLFDLARTRRPMPPAPALETPGPTEANGLLGRLKSLRRALADRQGVPAFVIFSDATLIDMARRKPRSAEELMLVNGVGPKKLDRYGEAFLRVLAE